jgi:hypothetical protein
MARYLTQGIVEGKASVLDNLSEPYLFLLDTQLDRLLQAVVNLAVSTNVVQLYLLLHHIHAHYYWQDYP